MSLRRLAATAAAAVVALTAVPAHAATPSGPAASADAYALLVAATLVNGAVPLNVGPISRATQDAPPNNTTPAQAQVLSNGPVPADSSVIDHVGVMTSLAGANVLPNASAVSQAADVALLGAGTNAKVTATLVRAQSNSTCDAGPNATGTVFENLVVNGVPLSNTPTPNTRIDVPPTNPIAVVIVNEQQPAADGRGFVVNALHIVSTPLGAPLFTGDVIVGHAASTVACPNGAGSTGSGNKIQMTKSASPNRVLAGEEVTYTAAVTNTTGATCNVNAFIEHLSPAFDFVSTSGDFGTALDKTLARPGGGNDLYLGKGKTIANNATLHQTFVVKVKDGTPDGVYYNNLEILCAAQGNYIKGLDAPVEVYTPTTKPPVTTPKPQCSDGKDNDGDGKVDFGTDPGCASPSDNDERDTTGTMPRTGADSALLMLGGVGLVAAAAATRRLALRSR